MLVPSAAKKRGLRCCEPGRAGRPDHRGRQWAPSQMGQAGAEAGLGFVVASPGLTSACSSPSRLSLPWTVPVLCPEAPSPSPATHGQRGPRPPPQLVRGGARMAGWWSRSPLRPPPPLVRPESGTGHRPSWPPTGKAVEGMSLLLLHVTPAAQRRHWSGVHVGTGASLTGPEGSSQRPTVANTGLKPQPGPDVNKQPQRPGS